MQTICHITSAHKRYDIRIFIKECISLVQLGYKVYLIVADGLGEETKDNVTIVDVGKPHGRFNRMLKIPQLIYKKVLELNPRIVHFHDPELMLMCRHLSNKGFSVIYDVHEDLPKQVKNKYWIPKLLRPVVSYAVMSLEKFCTKKYRGVVTSTPIIAKRFSKYNAHVSAVCNYPLLSELPNINVEWASRSNKLCYIGSISKTRGVENVILSLAKSELPLELAGLFSGDVSLEQLSKLDGNSFVNYRGVLDRQQIVDLLMEVKVGLVTLLPTPSYIESLPIKLFEYMLAGVPVVASNFKLWQDIIKTHNCGILVDPNNISEIADACAYLINNQDEAQQMGINGRNAVLKYYNWSNEVIKLKEFYSSCC